MKRLLKFIKEWASAILFAVLFALSLCALVVCAVQLSARIGVIMSACGLIGSLISCMVYGHQFALEIKDRR